MLSKALRLTARDIESLSHGRSVFGTLLSVRWRRLEPGERTKFGVSTSKKAAPRAVDRVALRRKGYKALEAIVDKLNFPAYIMVMPKKECLGADIGVAAIAAEISNLLSKAGVM